MMRLLKFIYCVFFLLLSFKGIAQQLNVKAELDSSSIRIGEQLTLKLSAFLSTGDDRHIQWPAFSGDTITSKIEVVSKGKLDTVTAATGQMIVSQKVQITSFDSGYHPIPPILFTIKEDTSVVAETDPLLFHVITVPVDTTKEIKDIKGPVDAPFHWKEAIPYIIGAVVVAILTALIIYYIRRRRRKIVVSKEPEIIKTADEIALEQLHSLENEKLWQNGKTKEYYIRLSDIMRVYIEQRFRVPAMEQTSDEILTSLRSIIDDQHRIRLRQILLLSDLVKFAKEWPISTENEMSIVNAKEFVAETKAPVTVKTEDKQ
jgi:hypothetical protein